MAETKHIPNRAGRSGVMLADFPVSFHGATSYPEYAPLAAIAKQSQLEDRAGRLL